MRMHPRPELDSHALLAPRPARRGIVRALAVLAALAALGAPRPAGAQGGVWTSVPVPGGPVYGVADGDSGTVLIAGATGAYRFDGFRRRQLPIFSATTDSLKGNCILRTAAGDVWFGTTTGVVRLTPGGVITRYNATNGIGNSSDSDVSCLAEGKDGSVWAGTSVGGLSHFVSGAWTTITTDDGLPSMSVAAVAVDPNDGSLWVGCLGATGGLAHVVGAVITVTNQFSLTPTKDVHAVLALESGRVWFGTGGGLALLDHGQLSEYAPGSPTAIVALAEGAHGEIWFGMGNRGIGWLADGRATLLPSGPPSPIIEGLYADAAGDLWVSTNAGLGRFEGAPVLSLSQSALLYSGFNAQCAIRDPARDAPGDSVDAHGAVWIGTSGTAFGPGFLTVVRLVNGRLRVLGTADGLLSGHTAALAPADSGQVWIGTWDGNVASGLARVALDGTVLETETTTLPSRDVFALERAGPGQVWVGGPAGVCLVDHGVVRPLRSGPAGVPLASVRGLDLDAQGRLWIATGLNPSTGGGSGAGAVVFDPRDSSYTVIDASAGLPTNNLTSAAAFANGDTWFGSASGAIRLSGGQVSAFGAAQGLPSSIVPRVVEGPGGQAWMAMNGGLVLYDGVNLTTFGVGDGLGSASLVSVFADSLGVIVPAGGAGISLVHPDRTPPAAEIQTAPPAATGSRDAQFAVRGGDLDTGTRGILLSYQLDGRAPTPFADDVSSADFPALPDGDHVFRLWAKDRALNLTPVPQTWAFTVDATPPRPIVQAPAFGDVVHDTIAVRGSVDDTRFVDYTVEARPQGATTWDTLFIATSVPAGTDTLYRWNTRSVLDGVWELRVGVLDSLGLVGYVQVTITIDNLAPGASVTSPARVDHVKGGRVYTTFGEVELDIPPDAFSEDQIVRIDPISPPVVQAGGIIPIGTTWRSGWLLRAGVDALARPATLIVQTPGVPAGVPVALYRIVVTGTDTTYARVGGARSSDGLSLSTTITSLGGFAVLSGGTAAGPDFKGARGLDCQPRVVSPNGGGFDTRVAISFDLGHASTGAVKVFDRAGRLVKEVVESGAFVPGRNVVFWDGRDGDGHVVPSGLYVVAARFDGETKVASVAVANR
jgi:ligand-binding sensor domain-containing protein